MTSDIVIPLMKSCLETLINVTFEYVLKVILKISDNNIITFLIQNMWSSLLVVNNGL